MYHIESDSATSRYDSKANWIIMLVFIEIEELPATVTGAIQSEYQGATIILAALYTEPGFEGYGAAFTYKKNRWGAQVSKEGKIIRRSMTSDGFDF